MVIGSITLGKFHKIHVCNLKEFKVYGSRSLGSDMIELLHAGASIPFIIIEASSRS